MSEMSIVSPGESVPSPLRKVWRPGLLTWIIVVIGLGGLGAGLYPAAAAWISSHNQARVIEDARAQLQNLKVPPAEQIRDAHMYNDALIAGVELNPNGNVPVSAGSLAETELNYTDMLHADDNGLMGRIKVPSIGIDLPLYHGTSEATLLRGAGHLKGSHLPVGGASTRSVITAHRGLASAAMFTNLDRLKEGETFSVETLGEVFVYRVFDIQVIDPDDTDSLRALPGEDLVTLVTCTPLGINSQRIVVTGKRVIPTPVAARNDIGSTPIAPGFPWWAAYGGGGLVLLGAYVVRRGFVDPAARLSDREGG